jgi:hypothetical protein
MHLGFAILNGRMFWFALNAIHITGRSGCTAQ